MWQMFSVLRTGVVSGSPCCYRNLSPQERMQSWGGVPYHNDDNHSSYFVIPIILRGMRRCEEVR